MTDHDLAFAQATTAKILTYGLINTLIAQEVITRDQFRDGLRIAWANAESLLAKTGLGSHGLDLVRSEIELQLRSGPATHS